MASRFEVQIMRFVMIAGFFSTVTATMCAQEDLPDGPGKETVQRMCTGCHTLSAVTGQRMSKDRWASQVDDMISRGAKGSDEDIRLVVDYLTKHFGKPATPQSSEAKSTVAQIPNPASTPTSIESMRNASQERPSIAHRDAEEAVNGVTYARLLQAASEPQNWLTYGGTYRSTHYSQLSQINAGNVKGLELKWVFQAQWLDPYETTPLVVDGMLYTTRGNDVVALDAASGKLRWIYRYTPASDGRLCCGRITRGLAMYGNTLYLAAVDAHLVAIDAKTGDALWDTTVAKLSAGYSMTGAPLLVKDKIVVGVAGGEYGIRGFVAAFDARTGKEAWRFNTVAGPGEPGSESWGGDSWKHGAGSSWQTGSFDPETNLLYWGIGNAGPDYNGDVRPGDNLYTCSMVALDPDTGKLKWHYQANPHNEFDWDAVQVPLLVDMQWQGEPRKVILWANRNGFFYVIDRVTGKFLLGKAFVKQNWTSGFDENGRPIMTPDSKSSEEGTLIYPDNQGGTNWFGPSYSARTGLFYVNAREGFSTLFIKMAQEFHEGESYTGRGRVPAPQGQTMGDDKFTAVRALDPQTGERKWEYKLNSGSTLNLFGGWQTNAGAAGILTTATDLLITGGREGNFVILDARNGTLLWQTQLGGPMLMNPVTYAVHGKQYIAINAGTSLFVFGLRDGAGK